MPGTDTIIQTALDRRNMAALFAALPLLKELDSVLFDEISREIEWFSLPGGATLYSVGQLADALYVVVNGALGLYAVRSGGGAQLCGRICPGETVGEMEVISGKPRGVSAIALRDTEVARISLGTFEKLVTNKPRILLQISNILVQRLEATQRLSHEIRAVPKTFALASADPEIDPVEFQARFASALGQFGRVEMVGSSQGRDRTSHWFHRLERANDFVVYVSDREATNWSKLCLRQADCTLLLARRAVEPSWWKALHSGHEPATAVRPAELILLSEHPQAVRSACRWLNLYPFRRHHHVRDHADIARVTRLLTGRAVGLVLSGGGARGFAHIGVMRALRQAKLAIDAVGATSIGAIIGAGWAAGWSYEEMVERVRRSFVETNPLGDYTFPLLALAAGRRVGRLLRREFGDTQVEDLRLPFFCASANLTNGQLSVHQRGDLWLWLRASVAIPGVLPPVFTNGQIYVDGATLNNLPVDIMRETLDGSIVAVDVGADRAFQTHIELTEMPRVWALPGWFRRQGRKRINVIQVLLRSGMINSATTTIAQRELADLVLKPPLEGIDLLDWRAFERVIEVGYRHASEQLAAHGAALYRSA